MYDCVWICMSLTSILHQSYPLYNGTKPTFSSIFFLSHFNYSSLAMSTSILLDVCKLHLYIATATNIIANMSAKSQPMCNNYNLFINSHACFTTRLRLNFSFFLYLLFRVIICFLNGICDANK